MTDNIDELQEKIAAISESTDINFRQYLIGQALGNIATRESRYANQNGQAAIAHADEVIKALAKEALGKPQSNSCIRLDPFDPFGPFDDIVLFDD